MIPFQIRNPGEMSCKYGIKRRSLHFNDNVSSCYKQCSQYVFHTMIKTENCIFRSLPEIFSENIICLEKCNSYCCQFISSENKGKFESLCLLVHFPGHKWSQLSKFHLLQKGQFPRSAYHTCVWSKKKTLMI